MSNKNEKVHRKYFDKAFVYTLHVDCSGSMVGNMAAAMTSFDSP